MDLLSRGNDSSILSDIFTLFGTFIGDTIVQGSIPTILDSQVVVTILGQSVLVLVDVTIYPIEDNSSHQTNNCGCSEIPSDIGVLDDARAGKANGISDCSVKEIESRHETSHVLRRAGIGNSVSWHVHEELGDATKCIGYGHPPNADVGDQRHAVRMDTRRARAVVSARSELVSVVVKDRISCTAGACEEESRKHTRRGAVVNVVLAEQWIEVIVQDWCHEDDGERVEVADNVVWDAVRGKHGTQSVAGSFESTVVQVLERKKAEDASSLKCTSNINNKLIVPRYIDVMTTLGDDRRLSSFEESSVLLEHFFQASTFEADSEYLEDVSKVAFPPGG